MFQYTNAACPIDQPDLNHSKLEKRLRQCYTVHAGLSVFEAEVTAPMVFETFLDVAQLIDGDPTLAIAFHPTYFPENSDWIFGNDREMALNLSLLLEFENELTNYGHVAVAAIGENDEWVILDDHKIIKVVSSRPKKFEDYFDQHGFRMSQWIFLRNIDHAHFGSSEMEDRLQWLANRI